jgi:hypothetical protein
MATDTTQAKRIYFVYDDDYQHETPSGKPLPGTEVDYLCDGPYNRPDGSPLPYAEYVAYSGNPDRHIVLGAIVQTRCSCCKHWADAGSLWGIDLMDDDPALQGIHISTLNDRLPACYELVDLTGYLAEIARDLCAEVR